MQPELNYAPMDVQLLDSLSSDTGICNAARVSFAKEASAYTDDQNIGVLRYLFEHRHWSPFAHARQTFILGLTTDELLYFFMNANLAGFTWFTRAPTTHAGVWLNGSVWAWHQNLKFLPKRYHHSIDMTLGLKYPKSYGTWHPYYNRLQPGDDEAFVPTADFWPYQPQMEYRSFRIKAPLFVARQLVKHQVGLTWNEESRRYIKDAPELFLPAYWRPAAKNVKQGSKDEELKLSEGLDGFLDLVRKDAVGAYERLLEEGVAAEQARIVLPLQTHTNWIWTGNLLAFARVCNERLDPHAQKECREIATQIDAILQITVGDKTWNHARERARELTQ